MNKCYDLSSKSLFDLKFSIHELYNLNDVMWLHHTRLPTCPKGIKPNVVHMNNFNWSERTFTWLIMMARFLAHKEMDNKGLNLLSWGLQLCQGLLFITFKLSSLHFSLPFFFFLSFFLFLVFCAFHFTFTFFLLFFTSLYLCIAPSVGVILHMGYFERKQLWRPKRGEQREMCLR